MLELEILNHPKEWWSEDDNFNVTITETGVWEKFHTNTWLYIRYGADWANYMFDGLGGHCSDEEWEEFHNWIRAVINGRYYDYDEEA